MIWVLGTGWLNGLLNTSSFAIGTVVNRGVLMDVYDNMGGSGRGILYEYLL